MIKDILSEYQNKRVEMRKELIKSLKTESPTVAKLYSQNDDFEIVDAQEKYQILTIDGLPLIIISDNDAYKKVKSILARKHKSKRGNNAKSKNNSEIKTEVENV